MTCSIGLQDRIEPVITTRCGSYMVSILAVSPAYQHQFESNFKGQNTNPYDLILHQRLISPLTAQTKRINPVYLLTTLYPIQRLTIYFTLCHTGKHLQCHIFKIPDNCELHLLTETPWGANQHSVHQTSLLSHDSLSCWLYYSFWIISITWPLQQSYGNLWPAPNVQTFKYSLGCLRLRYLLFECLRCRLSFSPKSHRRRGKGEGTAESWARWDKMQKKIILLI